MFRSIIISSNAELAHRLISALEGTGKIEVDRTLDHDPSATELTRTLRALASQIVFIDFESLKEGLSILKILESEGGQVQVVGFDSKVDAGVLRETMRAGVREFLTDPFEPRAVVETLVSVQTLLERQPAVYHRRQRKRGAGVAAEHAAAPGGFRSELRAWAGELPSR